MSKHSVSTSDFHTELGAMLRAGDSTPEGLDFWRAVDDCLTVAHTQQLDVDIALDSI
jgi:hypothetical protein